MATHEVQRRVQDDPRVQEPRRGTPGLFALSRWNNEVAAKHDGGTGERQVCRKDGKLGCGCIQPGVQATSWREPLEHQRHGWYSSLDIKCHPAVTKGTREV